MPTASFFRVAVRIHSLAFLAALPLVAAPSLPLWLEPTPDGNFLAGPQSLNARSVRLSAGSEMRIVGAGPSTAIPADPLPGRSNDLRGDPSRWRAGIPHYGRVRYPGVYPGIDLVYRAVGSSLEFDFEVAPGASPNRIALEFDADCRLDRGDLIAGDARLHAPRVFQDGRVIPGEYRLVGVRRAGFRIGPYDRRRPLLIDPVVAVSTIADGGPERFDAPVAIATDAAGSIYLASTRFITAFCTTVPTDDCKAVVVSKFDPTGITLVYSTLLGDPGETANGIAADRSGNVYVLTTRSVYRAPSFDYEARVQKLGPSGAAVLYAKSISHSTRPDGIAVDSTGNAYVTGSSTSLDFEAVNALLPQVPVRPMIVSSDGGATWSGITTLRAVGVNSLAVDPTRPSTLYAATSSGLFKSVDTGATWTRILPQFSFVSWVVLAGGSVFAMSNAQLLRSLDAGATWEDLTSAFPSPKLGTGQGFTVLAADPNNPANLWLGNSPGGESKIFRSTDGGAHWTEAHDFTATPHWFSGASIVVDPKVPGRVYLCCVQSVSGPGFGAIFRTDDNGVTWVEGGSAGADSKGALWSLDRDSAGALYAGSSGGIFRSLDAGQTWSKVSLSEGAPTAFEVGTFRVAGDTLLMLDQNGRLYRSVNGGTTWTATTGPWSARATLLAADSSASSIYVGAPSSAVANFVAKIDPSGAILWSTLLPGPGPYSAAAIAVDAAGSAYVAGSSGVDGFVSRFASDGSKLVYTTQLGNEADAVAVDSAGVAYVAGSQTVPPATFVAQVSPSGEKTIYTTVDSPTYAGATKVTALTLGSRGVNAPPGVWIAGQTTDGSRPVLQPLQPTLPTLGAGFLMELAPVGGAFKTEFSTYFGWGPQAITAAAPAAGGVWVAGQKLNAAWFGRVDFSPAPPAHPGVPEIHAVYNAASWRLDDIVAPGEIVTLMGTDLDNATVTVGGIAAQVLYTGATQINFVVPADIPKTGVRIVVRRGSVESAPRSVTVLDDVPGIFTIVHASDYSPVTAGNPAHAGEYLSIFCTGIGRQKPELYPQGSFGARMTYYGPAPGYPGLYQINVQIPEGSHYSYGWLSVGVNNSYSNAYTVYVE